MTNFLSFPSSEDVLIPPSSLSGVFAGYRFWLARSFLLAAEKCHTTFLGFPWFLMRNQLSFELFFHCGKMPFFFLCSQIFSFVFLNLEYFRNLPLFSSPSLITCPPATLALPTPYRDSHITSAAPKQSRVIPSS